MKKKPTEPKKQLSPSKNRALELSKTSDFLAFESLAKKLITFPKKELPKNSSKNKN